MIIGDIREGCVRSRTLLERVTGRISQARGLGCSSIGDQCSNSTGPEKYPAWIEVGGGVDRGGGGSPIECHRESFSDYLVLVSSLDTH